MTVSARPISYRFFWSLSWPATLATLIEPIAGMVDTAFLGRLDTKYLAAIAIAAAIFSSFAWIFNFIVNIGTATLSQALSSDEHDLLSRRVSMLLYVALALGFTSIAILLFFRPWIYEIMSVQDLAPLVNDYFYIRLLSLPLVLIMHVLTGLFRGVGKVKLALFLALIFSLLNIVFNYIFLFIFNWGPFGAGLGTTGSYLVVVLVGLACAYFQKYIQLRSLKNPRSFRAEMGQFTQNSFYHFVRSSLLTASFFLSTTIISNIGKIELASYQVGLQFWLLASYLVDGPAVAVNILWARFLGQKKQLSKLKRISLHLSLVFGPLLAIIYYTLRPKFFAIFTQDIQVIRILESVWPYICLGQVFNAWAFMNDGIMFGAHEYAYLAKLMLIGIGLIFLPILLSSFQYQSLSLVWVSFLMLNFWRLVATEFKVKQLIKT